MGILPREAVFFELFEEQANKFLIASQLLEEIKNDSIDLKELSRNFKALEHDCDEITHKIAEKLNKTFLTPFDREDIHALSHELDEVIDLAEESVFKLQLYGIKTFDNHMLNLVRIIKESMKKISETLKLLRKRKDMSKILSICIEINTLENEGDKIFREAMLELINKKDSQEMDSIKLMGIKEIYESLESTIDKCEDVANILEGIILKNI